MWQLWRVAADRNHEMLLCCLRWCVWSPRRPNAHLFILAESYWTVCGSLRRDALRLEILADLLDLSMGRKRPGGVAFLSRWGLLCLIFDDR
jgi:hypothetical protein